MKNHLVFNNKRYRRTVTLGTKREAQREAKHFRKNNILARVVFEPSTGHYHVYTRDTGKW